MPDRPPTNPVLALAAVVRATGHGGGWAGRLAEVVVAEGLAAGARLRREPAAEGPPGGDAAGVDAGDPAAEAAFEGGSLRLWGPADPGGAGDLAAALAAVAGARVHAERAAAADARARTLELAASEQRFRMLAERTSDVISRHSLDGRFTWVSPSLKVVLGHEPEHWLGRLPREFVHPDDVADVISARPELLAEPDRTVVRSFRMRHADGGYRQVEAASRWFRGVSRDIVVVLRDVGRRVEAEREARALHAADAVTGRRSSVAELAAVLAHELNQPLTALANYAAVVARLAAPAPGSATGTSGTSGTPGATSGGDPGEGPDRLVVAARRTHEEALRAQGVLERIRGFVRQREPRLVPVDLPALLAESARGVRAAAEASGVKLEVRPARPARFEGDPVLLRQVLVNLLTNAVQAASTGDTRRVTLSGEASASGVSLRVRDSGPRLREEQRARLFEPFHTTRGAAGLGLGLVISRSIVRAHGGSLRAVAPPAGDGLSLVAELPRSSASRPLAPDR